MLAHGIVLNKLQCCIPKKWMNVLKGYAVRVIGSVSPTIYY